MWRGSGPPRKDEERDPRHLLLLRTGSRKGEVEKRRRRQPLRRRGGGSLPSSSQSPLLASRMEVSSSSQPPPIGEPRGRTELPAHHHHGRHSSPPPSSNCNCPSRCLHLARAAGTSMASPRRRSTVVAGSTPPWNCSSTSRGGAATSRDAVALGTVSSLGLLLFP
jgi:hypothetical protein